MRKQSGFTLIEALITMVIVGVLASMAIPSFKTVIYNDRLVTAANDVLGSLNYTRAEATELHSNVTICASNDQNTCSGTATGWASGWLICQEPNTTTFNCGSGATNLRVHGAFPSTNKISNDVGVSTLTFTYNGVLTNGVTTNVNIDVCDSRGNSFGRSVYIYPSGQARASPTVGKRLDNTAVSLC